MRGMQRVQGGLQPLQLASAGASSYREVTRCARVGGAGPMLPLSAYPAAHVRSRMLAELGLQVAAGVLEAAQPRGGAATAALERVPGDMYLPQSFYSNPPGGPLPCSDSCGTLAHCRTNSEDGMPWPVLPAAWTQAWVAGAAQERLSCSASFSPLPLQRARWQITLCEFAFGRYLLISRAPSSTLLRSGCTQAGQAAPSQHGHPH